MFRRTLNNRVAGTARATRDKDTLFGAPKQDIVAANLNLRPALDLPSSVHQLNLLAPFSKSSLVQTAFGWTRVDGLRVGDLIQTIDGPKPLRGIVPISVEHPYRKRHRGSRRLAVNTGSLNAGLPCQPLHLTADQGFLVSSRIVNRLFGVPYVLVPAHNLLSLHKVEAIQPGTSQDNLGLIFDSTQIVLVSGVFVSTARLSAEANETVQINEEPVPFIAGRNARNLILRHAHSQLPLGTATRAIGASK